MIIIICIKCSSAIRVLGEESELQQLVGEQCDWYPMNYPCWREDCDGVARYCQRAEVEAMQRLDVRDLTPHEAFLALHQMGMPEDRDCSAAAVRELLQGNKIVGVTTRQIRGSHRCTIDVINMEDGTRVYLAAGPEGAIVYRISKPHSYTQEVLHEQNRA